MWFTLFLLCCLWWLLWWLCWLCRWCWSLPTFSTIFALWLLVLTVTLRGGCSRPHCGCQYFRLFLRTSDNICSRSELFKWSFGGGLARDSDAQVKTLFYSSVNNRISHLHLNCPKSPFLYSTFCVYSLNSMVVSHPPILIGSLQTLQLSSTS